MIRMEERLERIEVDVCLKELDRSCVLARPSQDFGEPIVDEIGIELEGSLEFGEGGVVPVLEKQDISKLSASLREVGVKLHRRLRQFKRAIEGRGTKIIESLQELGRLGRAGRMAGNFHYLHQVSIDSAGNIYTAEVDSGKRLQKFLRYGPSSCSGAGSDVVGGEAAEHR